MPVAKKERSLLHLVGDARGVLEDVELAPIAKMGRRIVCRCIGLYLIINAGHGDGYLLQSREVVEAGPPPRGEGYRSAQIDELRLMLSNHRATLSPRQLQVVTIRKRTGYEQLSIVAGRTEPAGEFRSLLDWMEANDYVHRYRNTGERDVTLYPGELAFRPGDRSSHSTLPPIPPPLLKHGQGSRTRRSLLNWPLGWPPSFVLVPMAHWAGYGKMTKACRSSCTWDLARVRSWLARSPAMRSTCCGSWLSAMWNCVGQTSSRRHLQHAKTISIFPPHNSEPGSKLVLGSPSRARHPKSFYTRMMWATPHRRIRSAAGSPDNVAIDPPYTRNLEKDALKHNQPITGERPYVYLDGNYHEA